MPSKSPFQLLKRLWTSLQRFGAFGRLAASRTVASVSPTVVLSLLAIALASATFYRNFLYTNRALDIVITDLKEENDIVTLQCMAVNTGNRDAAIVDGSLFYWWQPQPLEKRLSAGWTPLGPLRRDYEPIVIKPSEIKVLRFSAPLDRQN